MSTPDDLNSVNDDLVLPFQIEGMDVRGRIARLGPAVDKVLNKHDYPAPVSTLVGEALVLVSLLGSALKFDGTFTLQARGDGPISLLVADYCAPGVVRGYAEFDAEKILAVDDQTRPPLKDIIGAGYLALTIDPGGDMDRYQGIVELEQTDLTACALKYFTESEQIKTAIRLSIGQVHNEQGQSWRAGGIMVQELAADGGVSIGLTAEDRQEHWNRATILMSSVEDHELIDPLLSPAQLLFRLFHEDGVRVFSPKPMDFGCRCARERVEVVLAQYPREDLLDMLEDGKVVARCQFCSAEYRFDPERIGTQKAS